ncbi:MAG: ABC transporter substrate-binding protein [archaeon]
MQRKTLNILIGIVIVVVVVNLILLLAALSPTGKVVSESGGEVVIGAIMPLTGDISTIGQNTREGIELAVKEVNDAGGINGKKLRVIYEDGQCGPKEASNAANKLVNVNKVPVIIGGLCSSETLAVAPIAESSGTVAFSMCSSNPGITDAGDYVFRSYPSDNFQGKYAAQYAYNELGARDVAIMSCLSDWCFGIQEVFTDEFENLGGKVVEVEEFEMTATDLRTQLTKIKQKDPDMIYFLSYTDAGINGLKQIKELGINVPVLGGDAWNDPKLATDSGSAAEGIMWAEVYTPLTSSFKADLKARTGSDEITLCTPQGYDNVHIIAEIMRRVGTDPDAIRDALYSVEGYPGVSGVITIDGNGDLASANYVIKTIKNGKAVAIN